MLPLHSCVSMSKAIAEFGGNAQMWCDEQFAVLPTFVLCFFTISAGPDGTLLAGPSRVVWKPQRLDYAPNDEYSWLPSAVREVNDRSGPAIVHLREHILFIRTGDMDHFWYVGKVHLGSYGTRGNGLSDREACFSLYEKVPREIWLACGGYSGWRTEIDHKEHICCDLASFKEVLNRFTSGGYSHFSMTRYEEDSLAIHMNPRQRAWVMYLRDAGDSGLYVDDPKLGAAEEHFRCVCGISLEFPASQTVSTDGAARIAQVLFETGSLPEDVCFTEQY